MADSHTLYALRAKRAELAGEIRKLGNLIDVLRGKLRVIDGALALFAPGFDPLSIIPKRPCKRSPYFKRHEIGRLCLAVLRQATEPMPPHSIALAVLKTKGMAATDERLTAVTRSVRETMKHQRAKGTVQSTLVNKRLAWTIAKDAEPTLTQRPHSKGSETHADR